MRVSGDSEPFLKLKMPLIKRRATDAQFATDLWHRQTGFNTFQDSHDLAVDKSQLFHAQRITYNSAART
jgi:hypothetical protein